MYLIGQRSALLNDIVLQQKLSQVHFFAAAR